MLAAKRFKSVDSLRGIAAIAVVLYHLVYAFHQEYGYSYLPYINFKFGFFGVELFFIISGYVIYYSLSHSKNVRDFLVKRFIRLYPTYWLCMIVTFLVVAVYPLSSFRNTSVKEFLLGFSMFQGLFGVKCVDPSYWSLLIELMFYLGMSVIFFFKLFKHIYLVLIVWLLLICEYNFFYKIPYAGAFLNMRYGSLFIAGICFYKMKVEKDDGFMAKLILLASFIVSIYVLNDVDGSMIALPIVFLLFIAAVFIRPQFFEQKILLFLGKISYPLYLIHQNIGFVILKYLKGHYTSNPIIVLFPIAISILLAWAITQLFEEKIDSFLKRILLNRR